MQKARTTPIDEDLANLEDWLRRLKVEYDIFFNGHRKKPPDDLKMRVEKLVKQLSEVQNMSIAQRFRYNTLITRFYVHRDKWRRTLQARELSVEGRETPPVPVVPPLPKAIQMSVSIVNPETEKDKVQRLYDALVKVQGKHTQTPSIPYAQFAQYIAQQTKKIRGKYGCSSVLFTIALEEDAVRFTAKAGKQPKE